MGNVGMENIFVGPINRCPYFISCHEIYMSQCSKNTAISMSLEAAFGPRLPRGKKPNIDFLLRSLSNIINSFCHMHIFGINFFKK